MININYGHNQELMRKCQKLKEYAIFIETARKFTAQYPDNMRKAITKAVDECIANNILKDLLVSQKAEVLETMVWTFNKELYEKELRENAISEGHAEGRAEGIAEGRAEGRVEGRREYLLEVIGKKLRKNLTVEQIAEALEESQEVIEQYVNELQNK